MPKAYYHNTWDLLYTEPVVPGLEPLYSIPTFTDQELVDMASLWSPNDQVARKVIIDFANRLLERIKCQNF